MNGKTRVPNRAPAQDEADHRPSVRRIVSRRKLIVAGACLFGGAVIANALLMQSGKHPAPMFRNVASAPAAFPMPPQRPGASAPVRSGSFARADAPPAATKAATAAAKPAATEHAVADPGEALLTEIQRELAKRGYYKGDADGKNGPRTTQAIRDFQFAQRVAVDGKPSEALLDAVLASKVTMKDELLDLVRRTGATDTGKSDGAKAEAAKPAASPSLATIQRALNKAGYGPLEEDGHMGPSTKQALAKFEADRKLPPRGEPRGPVLQLLASATGITIRQP